MENQPDFVYDSTGKITGYKTKAGADTVFPFKSGVDKIIFRLVKTYDAPTNYTNRHIYADLYSDDNLIKSIEVIVFQAYGDVANKVITTWTLN